MTRGWFKRESFDLRIKDFLGNGRRLVMEEILFPSRLESDASMDLIEWPTGISFRVISRSLEHDRELFLESEGISYLTMRGVERPMMRHCLAEEIL